MYNLTKSMSACFIFLILIAMNPTSAVAVDSAAEINRNSKYALDELYRTTPGAKELSEAAVGVLVFPKIVKGGFVFGGQFGEGTLFKHGEPAALYQSAGASWGLQAGIQKFSYALFLMNESDLEYLNKSKGWELGVGPSLVVVDQGMAKSLTSTTLKEGVYAFIYGQTGLMAGVGIQGSKITQIYR